LQTFLTNKDSRRLHYLWYNSCFNWITDENDNILVDVIIRFENLDEDWRYVAKTLNLDSGVLPHRNRIMRDVDWRTHYDEESTEMTREHFAADIEAFGYSFG